MIHPALRYLVTRRIRNRVVRWLHQLRTPLGLLGALVILLIGVGMAAGSGAGGSMPTGQRMAVFVTILGFLLVVGVLSGLGQRGLIFTAADLDFLFPAPFPRRQLVLYQFLTHYVGAAVVSLIYVVVFGGIHLPHPALFFLGAFLCQVTSAHLATAAAELSMLLADTVFRRLRRLTVLLVVAATLSATFLMVAGLSGWGDVPAHLQRLVASDAARIVLFPAVQAVALGAAPDLAAAAGAFVALLACVAGSFLLVMAIPADLVENSFATSRRAHERARNARRGVRPVKVVRSARGPRSRWFRGAGAVLWLNGTTLRRQLRATLGGLFVVVLMFLLIGTRSAQGDGPRLGGMLLGLLAAVPLWMPLPIGFRLPREQLAELRRLPFPPLRLASALLVVPILAPFLLQTLGVLTLLLAGRATPSQAPAVLVGYVALATTVLAVEGMYVLRRPHPNAVNLLLSLAQILTQMAALLPGLLTLLVVREVTDSLAGAVLAGAAVQTAVNAGLLASLGRQLQTRDLEGGTA